MKHLNISTGDKPYSLSRLIARDANSKGPCYASTSYAEMSNWLLAREASKKRESYAMSINFSPTMKKTSAVQTRKDPQPVSREEQ